MYEKIKLKLKHKNAMIVLDRTMTCFNQCFGRNAITTEEYFRQHVETAYKNLGKVCVIFRQKIGYGN